jgi:hypothetical protein
LSTTWQRKQPEILHAILQNTQGKKIHQHAMGEPHR